MALNGKYTTVKTILDEVYRDNEYDIEVPWQDSVEWIYDAMELIRVPMQYVGRKAKLTIDNYRSPLPCDYHREVQVAGTFGGCNPFPMRDATNTFHPTLDQCDWDNAWQDLANSTTIDTNTSELAPIGQDSGGNPVFEILLQGDLFALNKSNVVPQSSTIEDTTYKITDSHLFTNFKEGFVYMAYYAFPVDDEGYPLIPEDTKYKEAVKAYVRMKIDYKLWRKGRIADTIYQEAKQNWAWRVGQAQNGARIPTIAKMEGIKNQQLKLVQNKYHYNNFFKNLSK